MKIHDLIQGSPEWKAYRAQHFNASDAPAMMGCSPYKTRAELLREMHTGVPADVDIATQKRFDNGHRAEALARPLAEEFIGAELYPVTGSLGKLSASFDGLTLDETEGFEHKALNEALRGAFADMATIGPEYRESAQCRSLPLHHRVQMEQQLLVSGAERILFMASKWTADDELVEEQHCWYYPHMALRQQIVDGWAQFERDLATYTLPPSAEAAPVGKAPETLPALRIELKGEVTASNLAEFKQTALSAIRSVNRTLETDEDFADARKAIKWCEEVEAKLQQAKEAALSQTASIDALFKALGDIAAESKAVRLDLDKLVTRRSVEVKEEAVVKARDALALYFEVINAELSPHRLQPVAADFAGAIKGKRSVASMQDALDTTLAAAKIAADGQARGIRANVLAFKAKAAGFEHLFADLGVLVHKPEIDFCALIDGRIATHKAAEAEKERQRQAAEAQRIAEAEARARAETEAKVRAEQEAQAAEQRRQEHERQQAESKRIQSENDAAAALRTSLVPANSPITRMTAVPEAAVQIVTRQAAPRADEPATLTLGAICERLGFTVNAQFLVDTLHVKAAAMSPRKTPLFTESQFVTICRQLASHVSAMAELYAGETA